MNALTGTLWRTSTRPVGSVRSVSASEPIIVLTFDDGPFPGSTEGLLQSLADFDASATFFVVMTRVRRFPDLVTEMVRAGHEVALHGPDHVRLTELPTREIVERTRAARLELEDLTGTPVRWFRPPYGSQSLRSWAAVRRAGLMPVMWGGTTWDWKDVPTEQRLTKVQTAMAPGQIVLAHDVIAGTDDGAEPREPFDLDRGAFIRELLTFYREHGYRALSLGEALARGASLQRWAWFGR
jgi:peptidoglycan/xylan/chitin deacetylase (PgdA/CDA1 family)